VIFIVVVFALAAAYFYSRNPAGCAKLVTDLGAITHGGLDQFKADLGPAITPAVPETVPIVPVIDGHLVSADGSAFTFPANAPASSLQYVALYFSAQWCPPCQTFTPVLVQWYKKFKPAHPEFELVFVSDDHDKASWLSYMKEKAMPWPAFSFDDLDDDGKPLRRYESSGGIPDLVLVDASGKVVADTFTPMGTFLGPERVLPEIEKILGPGTPPEPNAPLAAAAAPAPKSAVAFAPPPTAWAPPAVTPAQPNWTWTTSDGTTYQNVMITKIGAETVSITHSMGVAHDIPIANLPPAIQKQLNYDPVAAASARTETAREVAHPYYTFPDRAEAQEVARQLHWPLAWMEGWASDLSFPDPPPESEQDLTQRALESLKTRSVVIFLNGNDFLGVMSPVIRNQLFTMDDGPLPDGHHFYAPKIVLTDPDITVALGRISKTQMAASGMVAIDQAFAALPTGSSPVAAPAITNAGPATAVTPPAWTPPATLPAQPNWTWTTLDGTTYQNVVVTKIGPRTVSIRHSAGVANDIPLSILPPEIRKILTGALPASVP
jgi:nucleoredoxin